MSKPSNSTTMVKKFWNIITHNKFAAIGTLVAVITSILGTSAAIIGLPQIQNIFTRKKIDKPLLCSESTYPIKIKYPESYVLDCTEDAFSGEVAKLIAPRTRNLVKVFIVVNELQQLITLDEYIQSSIKIIKKNSSNAKVVNNQAILGDRAAYELHYTIRNEERSLLRREEVVMLDSRRAYHVIYEAPIYLYDRFKNDAQEMIYSFEIVKDK